MSALRGGGLVRRLDRRNNLLVTLRAKLRLRLLPRLPAALRRGLAIDCRVVAIEQRRVHRRHLLGRRFERCRENARILFTVLLLAATPSRFRDSTLGAHLGVGA
jgi:hypothetical protein